MKSQLTSDCLLVHFDPQKPLILACDASPYGVGAVMSHRQEDGSERPIAFASRSLSPAEKGYAQLDKEALAIVLLRLVSLSFMFTCMVMLLQFTQTINHYSTFSTLVKLYQLWVQLEYSVGHYFLVRISIQFLTSQDLRWPT